MLDVMDIGCPVLRTPFIEQTITLLGHFGHAAVGVSTALALLAHGYLYDNERSRRAGMAVLIALIAVGILTELLKNAFQLPRPRLRSSYGFPSGHTGTAFALASTLATAFPPLGPLWFVLAVLTGFSRLYLRMHYTLDVVGGMVLGTAAGLPIARKFVTGAQPTRHGFGSVLGWLATLTLAIAGYLFFYSSEKNIDSYLVTAKQETATTTVATLDFGTPQARPNLRYGWSGDETWAGNRTVVWASGLASEVVIDMPSSQDFRFRVRAFPYAPKGPACQRVEVRINNSPVAKILLQPGWHSYEFAVPQTTVNAGRNTVNFYFDYAEAPKTRGRNLDERQLSVAFDSIEFVPELRLTPNGDKISKGRSKNATTIP